MISKKFLVCVLPEAVLELVRLVSRTNSSLMLSGFCDTHHSAEHHSSLKYQPGNQISFLLRSVTKINKQQLNDSDWGFCCKITGYKFKKERRTLHHLEHILADLAGSCVRVMISPCNNSLQKLSQVCGLVSTTRVHL